MDAIGFFLIVIGLIFATLVGVWVYVNGWKSNGLWKAIVGGLSLALILIGSVLCVKKFNEKAYDVKLKYGVKRDEAKRKKQEEKERKLAEKKARLEEAKRLADEKEKEIKKRKDELDKESENTNNKIANHNPVSNNSPDDGIVGELDNLGGKK